VSRGTKSKEGLQF
jgi:hypothetical protein